MFVLFLSVGAAASLLGASLVAIGIPINEFGLGNTLIVAGTTLFTGGLIVMALAAVVRQLGVIAGAMQPAFRSDVAAEGADYDVAARSAPPLRAPAPSRRDQNLHERVQDRGYEAPAVKPRLDQASLAEPIARRPSAPEPDSPMMDDPGNFPLSPLPPPRLAPTPALSATRSDEGRIPSQDMPRPVGSPLRAMRAEPQMQDAADASKDRGPRTIFDALWPDEAKKRRGLEGDSGGSLSEPSPIDETVAPARDFSPEEARDAMKGSASASQKPTVLKSGVIEGMAYTLYTDGSIEAQMSQGVIRFGSIEELRAHLETTDSS